MRDVYGTTSENQNILDIVESLASPNIAESGGKKAALENEVACRKSDKRTAGKKRTKRSER